MVQFGDDTYGEERAIEKLFRCIPKKYKQIARSIESLLNLSMMLIKEAIGRLKVVDGDEPQPLSGPITIGGKLHLTREQWESCQGDGKKGESPPSTGRKDVPRVAPAEASSTAPLATTSLAIGPRSVDSHDAVSPTSHKWRRRSQLCS
jgi:hypothetical protein